MLRLLVTVPFFNVMVVGAFTLSTDQLPEVRSAILGELPEVMVKVLGLPCASPRKARFKSVYGYTEVMSSCL
ncbi:hypothetical protein D3C80_1887640 [compost metagenome]